MANAILLQDLNLGAFVPFAKRRPVSYFSLIDKRTHVEATTRDVDSRKPRNMVIDLRDVAKEQNDRFGFERAFRNGLPAGSGNVNSASSWNV